MLNEIQDYWRQLLTASAIGGILGYLGAKVMDKLIDNFFHAQRIKLEDKRTLASEVLKICSEGEQSKWSKNPKDPDHIRYVAAQIDIIDQIMGNTLRGYLNSWEFYSSMNEKISEQVTISIGGSEGLRRAAEIMTQDQRKKKYGIETLEELHNDLVNTAKKWIKQ